MSKTLSGLLAVGLLLGSYSLHAQTQRGMHVVIKDPETNTDIPAYNDSWAILIGIDKYQNVNQLEYAVADAAAIKNLLMTKFGFSEKNIVLLTNEQATEQNIRKAFGDLNGVGAEDRVVVFYAGHGQTIDLSGGGQMGFLIPVDGKAKSNGDLYATCMSMQDIKNLSVFIPAKHVLFLIDACYGGLAASGTRALTTETKGYIKKITAARARQILTAGGRDEPVAERSEWGHSAFTYKLLDGLDRGLADLNNDGLITATELADYIKKNVSVITDNKQTPQFRTFSDDEGDFVFDLGGEAAISNRVKSVGDLFIKSVPESAEVFIDGRPTSHRTPAELSNIAEGEHTVELRKERLFAKESLLVAPNVVNKIDLKLEYEPGSIKISSAPFEAEVLLDDQPQGKTPAIIPNLSPGMYRLNLRKEGYLQYAGNVEVKPGEQQAVNARLALPSVLVISSDPPEAEVYLDNKLAGKTPLTLSDLSAGEVTVKLSSPDYYDWQENADLKEGSRQEIKPVLVGKYGLLTVESKQENVEIYVDDTLLASGSLHAYKIATGKHDITFHQPSLHPVVEQIDVEPRLETRIQAKFGYFSLAPSWRSLIIPGWGQLYDDAPVEGWVLLLGAIGAGAYAGYTQYDHSTKVSDYNSIYGEYLNASTDADRALLGQSLADKYSEVDRAAKRRDVAIGLVAGVYGLSLLDALIFHSRGSDIQVMAANRGLDVSPAISCSPGSVQIGLRVRF